MGRVVAVQRRTCRACGLVLRSMVAAARHEEKDHPHLKPRDLSSGVSDAEILAAMARYGHAMASEGIGEKIGLTGRATRFRANDLESRGLINRGYILTDLGRQMVAQKRAAKPRKATK